MIGTGIGLGLAGYRINPAGGPVPVLDINFRDYKTFSSAIGPNASFSRASTGTYFDETGVLRSAAINAGRINHVYNGTSWVCKGGLIEDQRTNEALYSEDFSNAAWTKSQLSVSANATTAPDNLVTADKLVEDTAASVGHGAYFYNPVSAGNHTCSVFIKAAGRNWSHIILSNGAVEGAYFDLVNGLTGTVSSGITASIQNCGNGWFRCSVSRNLSAGNILLSIETATGDGGRIYTGNGSSGIFVWGAMREAGAFSTSYIQSTSSSVTRSADVMQLTGTAFSGIWNANEGSVAVECDRLFVGTADNWLYKFNASAGVDNINHQFSDGVDYSRVFYSGAPSAINYGSSSSAGVAAKFSCGFSSSGYVGTKNGNIADTKAITTIGTGHNELIIGNGGTSASPANFWNGHIARLRYWNTRLDNATLRYLST